MQLLRLNVVLAAIDDDDASVMIVRGANELAAAANARLHVVHVAPSSAASDPAGRAQAAERESAIRHAVKRAGLEVSDVSLHLPMGDAAHVIRTIADWIRADVIVLGAHRQRADGREIGSTALRVVTHSWAPCLVLSRPIRLPLERVLAPIDLSDASRGALIVALSWASALRGAGAVTGATSGDAVSLTALYVDRSDAAPSGALTNRALEDAVDRLRDDAGGWASVAIHAHTTFDAHVPNAIAEYAIEHHSDLVVLGTRGVGLDDVGRLGSVSLEVSRRLDIPLLLVPPAMWSTHTPA